MKKLFTTVFLLGIFFVSNAQIKTPAPSPFSKLEQTVGLTDVHVEYSRPSMKDRKIFGAEGLVPYGEIWRTGANGVTKVTFTEDVQVEGTDLKSGSYAILSLPGKDMWAVHFYDYDGRNWSSYKEKTPAAAVSVKPMMSKQTVETFTISIDDLHDNGATLAMAWENTVVPVKLGVYTDMQAMASIDKVLAGPSQGEYYNMASYYHSSGKDLNKALEFINMATEGEDKKFWQVRRKALILADLGKTKEAIAAATMSMELAKKAENADYVRMNEASIKEWSK